VTYQDKLELFLFIQLKIQENELKDNYKKKLLKH
jgi:hypothetical protein